MWPTYTDTAGRAFIKLPFSFEAFWLTTTASPNFGDVLNATRATSDVLYASGRSISKTKGDASCVPLRIICGRQALIHLCRSKASTSARHASESYWSAIAWGRRQANG